MKLPYRLAAVDLDDTLLGPDKRISAANAGAVHQLRQLGVHVVLASGRGHRNMLRYQEELGYDEFVVSISGGLVKHSRTRQVLRADFLPTEEARRIIASGMALGLSVLCYRETGVGATSESEWLDFYRRDSGVVPESWDPASLDEAPLEKIIWLGSEKLLGEIASAEATRYPGQVNAMTTNKHYLEFTPFASSKAVGVAAVAGHYGVTREQVMAFGDSNNDVPMLKWAGLGVAMAFAKAPIRAAARRVSPEAPPEVSFARAVEEIVREFNA